ncbi:MAG: RHS repeat-associated core domain-containing protein [Caldilineaceae bacterium]|nr:RHS repeat-associated core domain-containing protein [Caldilineaceae bacterium]
MTVWPYTTTAVKHYSFNGMRIAISKGGVLKYVHADHLTSTSVETDGNGGQNASRSYYAYGEVRASSGTLHTDRTYTGQKSDGTGLLYYNARYYDPALGTFLSPDTLVPDAGAVVDYNRFAYARNNPLKFSDPSGHRPDDGCETETCNYSDFLPRDAWVHPDYGVTLVDPEYLKDPVDALLIGAGGGGTLDTPLGFNVTLQGGIEYVNNLESGEQNLFLVGEFSLDFSLEKLADNAKDPLKVLSGGPAFKLGPAAGVYVGVIDNLPHNEGYNGQARGTRTSVSAGPLTVSSAEFYTPDDPNGPIGRTFGLGTGTGLDFGKTAYWTGAKSFRSIGKDITDWLDR